jgi:hypothetical protein
MTPYPTDFDLPGIGPADEAFAEQLRQLALEADPVPDLVYESARAALSLRRLDAELAAMVHDSLIDGMADIRGPLDDSEGEVRMVTFEASGVSISAQISTSATGRSLLGQVAGADVTSVTVQTPRGSHSAEVAESGVFRLAELPSGSVRLLIATSTGELVGDWITV